MGEHTNNGLPVSFDGRLRLVFHGTRLTSDAGLLAYRELDEVLQLTEMASGGLHDWRTGKNTLPHDERIDCHPQTFPRALLELADGIT